MTPHGKSSAAPSAAPADFARLRAEALEPLDLPAIRAWAESFGMEPPKAPEAFLRWAHERRAAPLSGVSPAARRESLGWLAARAPGPRRRVPAGFTQPDLFDMSDLAGNGAPGEALDNDGASLQESNMDAGRYARSKYLKADDLDDGPITLTVTGASEEKGYGGDPQLCLTFREDTRRLGLNATNTRSLVKALGRDTDAWSGRRIELYQDEVQGWLRVRALTKELAEEETPF